MARILIADDHRDNLNLLGMILEQSGLRALMTRDGVEAVEQAWAHAPDPKGELGSP